MLPPTRMAEMKQTDGIKLLILLVMLHKEFTFLLSSSVGIPCDHSPSPSIALVFFLLTAFSSHPIWLKSVYLGSPMKLFSNY